MKQFLTLLIFVLSSTLIHAQTEKYPVFEACESQTILNLPTCFKQQVQQLFKAEFILPNSLKTEQFNKRVNVVFVVTDKGEFKVIHVNSPYLELKREVIRVFDTFPTIQSAKYNNKNIEMQFVYPLTLPLENNNIIVEQQKNEVVVTPLPQKIIEKESLQKSKTSLFPEHNSELNIPFTHFYYNQLEGNLIHKINTHTAVKPYVYSEVNQFVNLDETKNKLLKPRKTWFGRKLWNEHMGFVQGNDFWFTIDPVVDLQLGKDNDGTTTYTNTRAITFQGGIGKNLSFSTSFYESQARFANYVDYYTRSIAPAGGNPGVVPGRGIAKDFKGDAFDYPVAEAYLSFTPSKHFNIQFGHGKNFVGNGYRSLVLSDVSSPHTFLKLNTSFWKIKYTNIWMWMQDVRKALSEDGAYRRKFMATHYLSWNISKKINLGLFETIVWDAANDGGFNAEYLNPIIFYTAAEFSGGSRAGNAFLGFALNYKWNNLKLYSQVVLDELRFSEITSSEGWWGNKNGIQIGAKMFDAFGVENLFLQAEYNTVRPYTYSHDEPNYNFGQTNQPVAHNWGANFNEFIGVTQYQYMRWFGKAQLVVGKKGFDYNTESDSFSYGGNIFADNDNRVSDYGNSTTQGNTASIFIGNLELGYLVNPATNLKLFGSFTYKNFDANAPVLGFKNRDSTWISIGLKTDVFNWYFDF